MPFSARLAFALLFLAFSFAPCFAAEGFSAWLAGVRQEALQKGISQETVTQALSNIQHNPRVIVLDRKQPESKLSFSQYRQNVLPQSRIDKGRKLYREHYTQLQSVGRQYGVAPEFIVALWGMETGYGSNTGGFQTVASLATLAYDGRRSAFFRAELLNALKILDEDHIRLADMTGSWAGAMGQNQFMPSSFLRFAVDGNNDGKRDIWKSLPDVFASSANYLSQSGWHQGERWGRAVKLLQPVPEHLTGVNSQKSLIEWSRMGVVLPGGGTLPTSEGMYASLVLPDGPEGPAFLIYNNYRVIMKWNKSVYFATSVGLLADAIAAQDGTLNE
jgi:membrane-bound lytic murein transglycosylase B